MTSRKGCIISPQNSVSNFFETPSVYESSYQFTVYRDEEERFTALQPKDCSVKPISAGCSHLRALFVPKKRNTFREPRTEIHCFTQRKNNCWTIQSNHKMEERLMFGVHKKSILFHFTVTLVLLCYLVQPCCRSAHDMLDMFGFSKPYCDTPIFPWRTPSRNLV